MAELFGSYLWAIINRLSVDSGMLTSRAIVFIYQNMSRGLSLLVIGSSKLPGSRNLVPVIRGRGLFGKSSGQISGVERNSSIKQIVFFIQK